MSTVRSKLRIPELRAWVHGLGWRGRTERVNGLTVHLAGEVGGYPGFAVAETDEGLVCCRTEQESDGWLYLEPEGVAASRLAANGYLEHRRAGGSLADCIAHGCCVPLVEALGPAFAARFRMEQRKSDGRATRSQVLTYSDDPEIGVFCAIVLPDGERLLVSVERGTVRVSRAEAPGLTAGEVLWESADLAGVARQLGCVEPSPGALLAALRDLIVRCESVSELTPKLPDVPPDTPPPAA